MANSITTTQFALRIASVGKELKKENRKAVGDAALIVKRSIERQTRVATKGSMGFSRMDRKLNRSGRMSAVNPNSSKLRVGYDVQGDRRPTAVLVARGPWGLIEYGSDRHIIVPRLQKITGRGAKYARRQRDLDIAFGGGGAFSGVGPLGPGAGIGRPVYRVNHPGTKGKKPFSRGVDLARANAQRRLRANVTNVIADTVTSGRQVVTYIRGDSTRFGVGR
jgi:hypothetical protein